MDVTDVIHSGQIVTTSISLENKFLDLKPPNLAPNCWLRGLALALAAWDVGLMGAGLANGGACSC